MKITVFTPTYNRAYIIERCYLSLKKQSFHDFEWLVIDDGSTDETKELFENWIKEQNHFTIRYYWFENCGKQREINRALQLAKGELFFTVDSDDLLTNDALEKINAWDQEIPKGEKFCGFAGSDGDMDGNPTNPIFKERNIDVTFCNRYKESGLFIGHDRPWVFYTEIHKKYLYPEFANEKFISEAVVWNRMAKDGYKIRCYNDVIYLIEHQDVGLTNHIQSILKNNPNGYGLWISEMMDLLNYDFKNRFIRYYSFFCEMQDKYSLKEIAKFISAPFYEMILIYIIYNIKHRRK